jgi:hypothetical protein
MPAFAPNHRRPIKKEKPSKRNPRKLEEQTLPKSINRSAIKYPSLPGVEGAPAPPARLTARGTPSEEATGKDANSTLIQLPEKLDICNHSQRAAQHSKPARR